MRWNLVNLIAHLSLKPYIYGILIKHAQREGSLVAEKRWEEVIGLGWCGVIEAHDIPLNDAKGYFEDMQEDWDKA